MSDAEPGGLSAASHDGSPRVTDEKVNTATHLAGAVFALLGTVLLIVFAAVQGKPWHTVGFAVYGAALFGLFLASSLHHGVEAAPPVKDALRTVDYLTIFLLIAGTFTPICLVLLRGPLGWSVFGVTWTVAMAGIILKASVRRLPKFVTNTLFVAMGWIAAVCAKPLLSVVDVTGIALLAAGGLAYTAGAAIFALERPNPVPGRFGFHEIWHLFVIAGALLHYLFMYRCVLPAP